MEAYRGNKEIRRKRILREAEGYLELGLPRPALRALGRLGNPTDLGFEAAYLWGEALRETERYHEALLPLKRAAGMEPENIHVWFALGWCYKRTGQIEMAIDALERALAVHPGEPLAHYNLACYWSLVGNRPQALQYLGHALKLAPQYRGLIDEEPDFDAIRSGPQFHLLSQFSDPDCQRRGGSSTQLQLDFRRCGASPKGTPLPNGEGRFDLHFSEVQS